MKNVVSQAMQINKEQIQPRISTREASSDDSLEVNDYKFMATIFEQTLSINSKSVT